MASTFWFIPFTILCLSSLQPSSYAAGATGSSRSSSSGEYIPTTYKINQKQTECLYDQFQRNDFVTFSVFVTEAKNNGLPKATVSFEGPISGNKDVLKKINAADERDEEANNFARMNDPNNNKFSNVPSLGRELRHGTQNHWPKLKDIDHQVRYDKRIGVINRSLKVDWTHAGENEDAVSMRAQIESEKKEAYRNYGRGPPSQGGGGGGSGVEKFRTITRAKIEPFEETNTIKAPGWYRLCVTSDYHALSVEMDIRSGNKLGGVDRSTGHVYTYEARELLDEEKSIDEGISAEEESQIDANTYASIDEELQKEIENQVKEQHLHASKSQMKHLNTMVMEMKKKHTEHSNRIKMHKASGQRNYDNLIWSSKLETLLYIMITGMQVYTVRKWLLSNSLLGQ
ncbi:hypothetical protein ACHAXR_009575 [Thalassiosira sp. AJA248-18]